MKSGGGGWRGQNKGLGAKESMFEDENENEDEDDQREEVSHRSSGGGGCFGS